MSRVEDWPEKLFATISSHDKKFEWGTSDCMQLVLDCAEAITGIHPFPKAKPSYGVARYVNKYGSQLCLKRHGFDSIIEALNSVYEIIPVASAQRGDIGIVKIGDNLAACVCEGASFVGKAPEDQGLVRFKRSLVLQAFRVC